MKRYLLGLLALIVGLAALPSVAFAGNNGPKNDATKVRAVELSESDLNGFGSGQIIEWSTGNTQIKVNISPDDTDGSVNDGTDSTPEWSLEFYVEACDARKGYPVHEEFFANDPTYGPRINVISADTNISEFANGCIFLVHEGSTSTQHAIDLGYSGRHVLAVVDVASNTVTY